MRQWLKQKFDSEIFLAFGFLFLIVVFLWGIVFVRQFYFPQETITLVAEQWTCIQTETVISGYGFTGSTPFPIFTNQCTEYLRK